MQLNLEDLLFLVGFLGFVCLFVCLLVGWLVGCFPCFFCCCCFVGCFLVGCEVVQKDKRLQAVEELQRACAYC